MKGRLTSPSNHKSVMMTRLPDANAVNFAIA